MAERRGIQRIHRLLADHVWPDTIEPQYKPDYSVPEYALLSQAEVMVECTAALIEELHDAMGFLGSLAAPVAIIRGPEPP